MKGVGLVREQQEQVPVSLQVNQVYGATETVLTAPTGKNGLVLNVESGSFRARPGNYVGYEFTVADQTENTLTVTGHPYADGDGPYQLSNSGGALPAGLAAATDYYVIVVDENTIKLATSYANAKDGTAVDVTGAGTGTQTIGGVPAAASAASITDGYASFRLKADEFRVLACNQLTVKGSGATDLLTYWFF